MHLHRSQSLVYQSRPASIQILPLLLPQLVVVPSVPLASLQSKAVCTPSHAPKSEESLTGFGFHWFWWWVGVIEYLLHFLGFKLFANRLE